MHCSRKLYLIIIVLKNITIVMIVQSFFPDYFEANSSEIMNRSDKNINEFIGMHEEALV